MLIVNSPVKEDFTVTDSEGNAITGLVDGDFTKKLYDPDGNEVSSTIGVIITELGNGNYRAQFTPNVTGAWYLIIYHSTYFPWGKANSLLVEETDINSILPYHANKKTLEKLSDTHYIEKIFNASGLSVIKEFDITVVGMSEIREPK